MRIALVHDYIKEYGGAERVLEALHEVFPDAPVFTTVYLPDFLGPHKDRFKDWDIRTSILQYLPFKAKLISLFRIIASFIFSQFDFSKFDIVIVSATGAYLPNAIKTKNHTLDAKRYSLHICYCHTPPRYLYGYATARDWKKNIVFKVLGEVVNHFLRQVDFKSAQNVDFFIANSKEVAGRIKKFYRRDSVVIYPPVDVSASRLPHVANDARQPQTKNQNISGYFLAGGRLARAKHIDLIVQACQKLNVPLKVFGRGFAGHLEEWKMENGKWKMENINFVGEVTDEEKMELMGNARAYIFASEDEDFGITPVEAMSAGTPVIAYRSGGVLESVVEGKTGLFFDELRVESLIKAIKKLSNLVIEEEDCRKQAEKFSKTRFKQEIQKFVETKYWEIKSRMEE